ncbi:hypothetical protein Q7C36_004059 [Tachysurus vachellii]|uniref:Uncharacterized protein n=1 Tax=Tachysurus vachellii TaxID=175792 RepID=A0AA88NXD4_TACVA|nr:hypothetical protein Q7C36_004059 [Tachysurus vachellii]
MVDLAATVKCQLAWSQEIHIIIPLMGQWPTFRVLVHMRFLRHVGMSLTLVYNSKWWQPTLYVWLTKQQEQTQITIGQNRKVKVNGNAVNSSTYQISNLAEIYQEQNFIVVNASHELMVYFDGQFTLLVRLGPSFHGSVCGMCGNNNGDPTDDKTRPNGELAQNDIAFGNSWKSNTSGPGGPFQHCHFRISPESYFSSCVYDLCAYPESLGQDLLCSAVEAYDAACTMLELMIQNWRSDLSCSRMDPCEDLHCTEDEWCGEKDGNYGCFCNENYLRQNPDSYDSIEICESSSGKMSLSRCQLFEAGFLANNLHLHDPNCNGTVQDGRLVFHFDNDAHICGTNLTANGTHFIYENIIQGEVGSTTGSIHRNKTLELRFSCIYKLSESLSMDREINPIQSIVHKTLPGKEGMYRIKMIPYEDSSFSHPYNCRVNIEVGEQIYIGVFVQGVDSCQLATVIDSCWATPVNQRNYSVRCDLITGNVVSLDITTAQAGLWAPTIVPPSPWGLLSGPPKKELLKDTVLMP